ncbi:MAG: hypothetical protein CMI02_12350 [Oceanospirillaceae bacterium]|nr:hypothetical protein [Oceanospirillaceae bacterium]|tara:strand:- start:56431 stop:56694 length:264 start_codon:yes stop_codon:yes gene_type:complete
MTIHHLRLSRGTVSLTERMLRNDHTSLALHLRNAMLTGDETIDLLLSTQQLDDLRNTLISQQSMANAGQQSLLNNLLERWPDEVRTG